ncbi:MAG: glycogen/starch synthase, partial [Gammaproteobacteria bacterium]
MINKTPAKSRLDIRAGKVREQMKSDNKPGNRVLFAASEVFPLIKTGGLADVACFLPVALHEAGHDIRIVLPAYGSILDKGYKVRQETVCTTEDTGEKYRVLEIRLPGYEVKVYLIDAPPLFKRPGGPYVDPDEIEWPDND